MELSRMWGGKNAQYTDDEQDQETMSPPSVATGGELLEYIKYQERVHKEEAAE